MFYIYGCCKVHDGLPIQFLLNLVLCGITSKVRANFYCFYVKQAMSTPVSCYSVGVSKIMPLSKQEFDAIYSKVPRLTVEVLIYDPVKGTYLTLRDIEPCKGQWHLPGGTVFFGENIMNAVKRVSKREVGIDVLSASLVGYIEYPSHYKRGTGYPVGLVFLVSKFRGQMTINHEASKGEWFTNLPRQIHPDQDHFLVKHNYLKA